MKPSRNPVISLLRTLLICAFAVVAARAAAETAELNSHEVNSDLSVTFRLFAPAAKAVTLSLDYDLTALPLQKSPDGVWSFTTKPLQPALHFYTFTVDGMAIYDPQNPAIKTNFIFKNNAVRVAGPVAQPWDFASVPHGVVHHHFEASRIITGLPAGQEEYFVYTPPGYNPTAAVRYPVLYLLHGWSGGADDWTEAGQVNWMLDNLIAQGRVVPMIVVMPQSYGALSFVQNGFKVWADPAQVAENILLFDAALCQEIIPQIERTYRVSADHAIAGLSMGGGQSLIIGLNHPEYFGWVGVFSPALPYPSFDGLFPKLASAAQTPALWISCGTAEDGVADTRKLIAWLKTKGMSPTAVEIAGIHNWQTWRDNFVHFAPWLFRPTGMK